MLPVHLQCPGKMQPCVRTYVGVVCEYLCLRVAFRALCQCVLSGPLIEVVLGRGRSFLEANCPEWGRLCLETKQEGPRVPVHRQRLSTAQRKTWHKLDKPDSARTRAEQCTIKNPSHLIFLNLWTQTFRNSCFYTFMIYLFIYKFKSAL